MSAVPKFIKISGTTRLMLNHHPEPSLNAVDKNLVGEGRLLYKNDKINCYLCLFKANRNFYS